MASSSVVCPPAYHSRSNGGHSVYKISSLLVPSGVIRVTTTDTLIGGLLMPFLGEFKTLHPAISLEIIVNNHLFQFGPARGRRCRAPVQSSSGKFSGLPYRTSSERGLSLKELP